MDEIDKFKNFAENAIVAAGRLALRYFRAAANVTNKATDEQFDPVTLADREVESSLRSLIGETYPSHRIEGEEFPPTQSTSEWTWTIDPIDGTRAFICGLLHWGVLLGLRHREEAVLGLLYQPFTDELFVGTSRATFYQRDKIERSLATRTTRELSQATLMTTDPRLFVGERKIDVRRRLESSVRLTRYGGDCYQYAMLAMGSVDVVVEPELKTWDIQPLIPIVRGAGGVVTTWDGKSALKGGNIVATSHASLHSEVLQILAS